MLGGTRGDRLKCFNSTLAYLTISLNFQEFDGNRDSDTVVRHNLTKPITASIIRFQPTEWHTHISMRVELYGCFTGNVCLPSFTVSPMCSVLSIK